MKKIIAIFICIATMLPFNMASAAIGDIEGYTKYTDIVAYINHYAIQSYNISDLTYVVAEDLRNFGFNVIWNSEHRSLYITRNHSNNTIRQYSVPYEVLKSQVGKNALPILSTDIKTYVDGILAKSFNIGGHTVVAFESLGAYGPINYYDDTRAIKLWVEDGLSMNSYMQPLQRAPIKNAYISCINYYSSYGIRYCPVSYALYDIDKDGNIELLVLAGTCEADYTYYVMKFNGERAVNIGNFAGGNGMIYADSKGVKFLYGHMGHQEIRRITVSGNNVVIQQLSVKEIPP